MAEPAGANLQAPKVHTLLMETADLPPRLGQLSNEGRRVPADRCRDALWDDFKPSCRRDGEQYKGDAFDVPRS